LVIFLENLKTDGQALRGEIDVSLTIFRTVIQFAANRRKPNFKVGFRVKVRKLEA